MKTISYSSRKPGALWSTVIGILTALVLALVGGALMPSLAHAADGESGIIEYSADYSTWGDTSKIVWSTDILIPGGTNTTTFYVRNASDRAGEAHFYVGDYEISDGMEAFLRVDVNGVAGNPLTVTGNAATPRTQLNSVHLAPGQSAKVAFVIGMPFEAGNSSQNGSITPNWSVDLTLDSTDTPVTPGGTGSPDFGSLNLGSASFGSLDTGSVKTGSASSGSLDVGSLGKSVTFIG
ncbi:hypothetical protein LQL77_03715 [Rhodococcus cerastii]|nr:hypothetical protein [Rhodococcus cerastii]